jgi:hypothetical protein
MTSITNNGIAESDSDKCDSEEEIFQSVLSCKPALTSAEINEIERAMALQSFGRTRRMGLGLCLQSGEWFKQLSEDKGMAQLFSEPLEALREQITVLDSLKSALECAHARAMVAMCGHEEYDPSTGLFSVSC